MWAAQVPEFIKITDLMRPAYFVPETKKCSQLFTEMTERKVQIAIVLDEYGGTAGLITLEDLVEDIVGNIQDEYDHEEEEIHRMSETEFTVDGAASIDEVADMAGVDLPEGDYDTIAGLVTERLGRLPKAGEHPQVKEAGLTITVLEVEEQRIARLLLVKDAEEESRKTRKQRNRNGNEHKSQTTSQENALGTAPIGKLLFSLAVPAITAQVVNMLYNIVDRIYIGHIPEIGTAALTGVGITFPIITLISAFSSLIAMGGAPRASIAMGAHHKERAEQIMGNCFTALLACPWC